MVGTHGAESGALTMRNGEMNAARVTSPSLSETGIATISAGNDGRRHTPP
jgi:hypothetical protein